MSEVTLLHNMGQGLVASIGLLIFGILLEKRLSPIYSLAANIFGTIALLTVIDIYSQDFKIVLGIGLVCILLVLYRPWKLRDNKTFTFIFGPNMIGSVGLYTASHHSDYLRSTPERLIGFGVILGLSIFLSAMAGRKNWRLVRKTV